MQEAGREVLGCPRGSHEMKVCVLDHEPNRDVPPRVGTVDHAELQLGKTTAHAVEMDRILGLARNGRAWEPGIDADGKVELTRLRVERVVHGISAVVHTVAPEARTHARVGHWVVA